MFKNRERGGELNMSEKKGNNKNISNHKNSAHPRRKRRRLSGFAYFLITFCVLVAAGVFAAGYFLKVETIEVTGKTSYTKEQIISASGIKKGENAFFTDRNGAARKICEKLPLVVSAKIHYNLFKGIVIETAPDTVAYEIKVKNGYASLDKNFKILEVSSSTPVSESLPLIEGLEISNPTPGQTLTHNDKEKLAQAAKILGEFKSNKIKGITGINISNDYEIKANYAGRIDILIGTDSDISYKLKFAAYLLKNKEDISDSDKGLLDVSQSAQSNKVSFIPS